MPMISDWIIIADRWFDILFTLIYIRNKPGGKFFGRWKTNEYARKNAARLSNANKIAVIIFYSEFNATNFLIELRKTELNLVIAEMQLTDDVTSSTDVIDCIGVAWLEWSPMAIIFLILNDNNNNHSMNR